MNSVQLVKSAKRRIEGWVLPAHVVFHHVPKCGGTSVGKALRQRYLLSQDTVLPEESFRAFAAFTGRSDRLQMLVDVLDLREQMLLYHLFRGVRCVSAHVRFSNVAFEQFGHQYTFVTILREPVSRFISHFFWSSARPHAHARIEEELPQFLETERARRLGAAYSEYFSGFPKETDFTSPEAVRAAIANLRRMDVVGRLDDLPAFESQLKARLGARIRIGHLNKMRQPTAIRSSVVSAEIENRVRSICAPDIAIWEAITGRPHGCPGSNLEV